MAQKVMISPIGFTDDWLLRPYAKLKPSHVFILHTPHKDSVAALKRVTKKLDADGTTWEDVEIKPDFDYVRWFREFDAAAVRFAKTDTTLNLTPSHGIAIAMGAVVASRRGLPCILYDHVDDAFHYFAPGVVSQLGSLAETDKALLEALRDGPNTVQNLSARTKQPLSTTSNSLIRLFRNGFLAKKKDGQSVTYSIRREVLEFLPSIIS